MLGQKGLRAETETEVKAAADGRVLSCSRWPGQGIHECFVRPTRYTHDAFPRCLFVDYVEFL